MTTARSRRPGRRAAQELRVPRWPWSTCPMLAVIPVRGGELPTGASEAAAEAGGAALVVGTGAADAAAALGGPGPVAYCELGDFAVGRWSAILAASLTEPAVLVLPASPDGRDLAPRLAHACGRPLLAGAVSIDPAAAVLSRRGGLVCETHPVGGPVVATLIPGVRGTGEPSGQGAEPTEVLLAPAPEAIRDARVLQVTPPDPATMDLAEARRVLAGGAGLASPERFEQLAAVAAAIGASPGATRVVADAGWVAHDRYIGTTGVGIDPDLYIAIGVSGAVQHVTGIGTPEHVIAVNTDPSAPMMAMADLAIVTDGPGLLDALSKLLGVAGAAPPAGAPAPPASEQEVAG